MLDPTLYLVVANCDKNQEYRYCPEKKYAGLPGNEQEQINYFSGFDDSGALNQTELNFTNNSSQQQEYTGLPSGDVEIVNCYSGLNNAGALNSTGWNYTNNSSQVEWFNPNADITNSTASFTAYNGQGTEEQDLQNLTATGGGNGSLASLYENFVNLGSGNIETLAGYTKANGTGTEKYFMTDHSNNTSLLDLLAPSSGVTSDDQGWSQLNGTGAIDTAVVDNSNNTSADEAFVYNPSGTAANDNQPQGALLLRRAS